MKIIQGEFGRFLLAGAINTLLSYLLYLFLLGFLAYLWAYSIAYCAGIAISYFLNVYFVFNRRASLASFVKFPFVYALQYVLGAGLLWLLVDWAGMAPAMAMLSVIATTIPVTFLASRFVVAR